METIFKLDNQIKYYDWGSPDFIPRLMGIEPEAGVPWAELWMGSHPGSPSMACLPSGNVSLGELIASDPGYYLGEKAAKDYGSLPFLFKLLAAGKPLSIQTHPDKVMAEKGFDRENRAGLALDAPNRNYKDSNHKPEIICALTPFTGMCGFRTPAEIRRLLEAFLSPLSLNPNLLSQRRRDAEEEKNISAPAILREGFTPLMRALETPDTSTALREFLLALFNLPLEVRKAISDYIISIPQLDAVPIEAPHSPLPTPYSPEWELMKSFVQLYPGDSAVIAPLYLNVFRLEPGEAVYLDAGILHAYVHGLGVELMANSDNVLRGGLTNKHIDVPELVNLLDFTPFNPQIIKPEPGFSRFTYPTPCGEFALTVMRGTGGTAIPAPDGPAIFIVTEGEVTVSSNETCCCGNIILKRGESAFVTPTGTPPLSLSGNYTLYSASLG